MVYGSILMLPTVFPEGIAFQKCYRVRIFIARWRHNFRQIAEKKLRTVQKSAEECVRATSYR